MLAIPVARSMFNDINKEVHLEVNLMNFLTTQSIVPRRKYLAIEE